MVRPLPLFDPNSLNLRLNKNLILVNCIFCAARPEEHQKHWLDMIPCIHPNATYMNINIGQDICRRTSNW